MSQIDLVLSHSASSSRWNVSSAKGIEEAEEDDDDDDDRSWKRKRDQKADKGASKRQRMTSADPDGREGAERPESGRDKEEEEKEEDEDEEKKKGEKR